MSSDALGRLTECARSVQNIDETIENLEETIKSLRSQRHEMVSVEMPEIMYEAGTSKVEVNGQTFSLETVINGTLPRAPAKRARAFRHLEEIGAGGLIKSLLTISAGRDSLNEVRQLARELAEWAPKIDQNVHTGALRALVKRMLARGENINLDELGLFTGPIVKVKGKRS